MPLTPALIPADAEDHYELEDNRNSVSKQQQQQQNIFKYFNK